MNRRLLASLGVACACAACTDVQPPTGVRMRIPGPSMVITGFSAIDAGAGPGDPRPNSDAAAARFDAAASALRPLTFETFESAPLGNFTSLTLSSMTVTLTGAGSDADAGITNVTGDAILGYNTTSDGSRHLRLVPPFASGTVTVTFTPTQKLQAWGAYFTGVGTVPNTSVQVVFDDGSAQTFAVPGNESGGATFFGFTDPDRIIASVTVRETLTSSDTRDILSIDDIRYAPASGNTQFVPAGQAATVTVQENGKDVAGFKFPAGTFANDVTVTVRFKQLTAGVHCHDYLLAQFGRCLEISALEAGGQKAILQQPAIAGLCLDVVRPLELYKSEGSQDRAVPLKEVAADFLQCDGFNVSSAAPNNWLKGLAVGAAKGVGHWLSPKPLYAAHAGFGGLLPPGSLSFFTWASPIQVASAGLVVNAFNSGKDLFAVRGTFNWQAKDFAPFLGEAGFDPARDAVTVGFGKSVNTIPVNSFKYSPLLKRWVYVARIATGITAMDINPVDGTFAVAATVLTEGAASIPRPFTLQIGHRTQGTSLACTTAFQCLPQEH